MRALTALFACATNTYALDPSLRRWRDAPIAQVTGGKVRGITTKDNVTAFYGVPYAKAKRYAAAADASWSGIRDATVPAEPCPQMAHGVIGHEDCLVANVFTAGIPNSPVMLQIHGGSMNAGRAVADGSALAKRAKAVIISIQYRLGALGFWAANASTPQNFGLDDLLFALRWARDNAAAFGGDPTRVMVFGVSAGGAAVAHLLTTAPPGLIFAAAMESPGGHQGWMAPGSRPDDDFVAPSVLAAASAATAAAVGCAVDDLICLRKVPNADIITAAEGVRFAPSLVRRRPANPLSRDGVETPLALLRLGAWQQGAVIIGGQSCESCAATAALAGPPRNLTHFEFVDALQTYFAGSRLAWEDVLARYTQRIAAEGRWRTLARVLGDSGHACSAHLHAAAVADGWVYEFEKATAGLPGATHGSDEAWLFQEKDSPLAVAMADYWGSLAHAGDPNYADGVAWPRSPAVLGLDDVVAPRDDTRRPECLDFWAPWLGFY
jgi:para-nitrobenzyl esterase